MNHSSHQRNANIAHVSRQQPDYIEIFAALRCREEAREREIKYIDLGRSWESENHRNGWRKHIERQSTQSCWVRDRRKQVSERWPVTRSCRVVWHSWQLREKWWMFWGEQKMEEWMNYKWRLLENFWSNLWWLLLFWPVWKVLGVKSEKTQFIAFKHVILPMISHLSGQKNPTIMSSYFDQ